MKYAPVVISVYDRLEHLQQCINSLRKNKEATKTDLFVAVDFPYKKEDAEKIERIKDYVSSVTGFNSVKILKREKNLGPGKNMRAAIDELFESYDRLITMEDDNVVSNDFLNFMNSALEFYEDDDRIVTICGYNYPVKIPDDYKNDVYTWPAFNAYGVGLWKRKDIRQYYELHDFEKFINDNEAIEGFLNVAEHILPILFDGLLKGKLYGDAVISYNYFMRGKFNLFPVVSRVKNIGYDGNGLNCGEDERFSAQQLTETRQARFVNGILPDNRINKTLFDFFRTGKETRKRTWELALAIREEINKKTKNKMKSPLTDSQNVTLEREIPVEFLAQQYAAYGVEVKRFFGEMKSVPLYRCNDTGFHFFAPPQLAGDGEFYEQLQKIPWYYMEEKWEFDVALALLKSGEKVLEIGSGKGGFLRKAFAKKIEIYGAELNKKQAENLRSEGFSVFDENIETLAETYSGSFDAVCAFQVLEHVPNPKSFIETSLKLLKKGGKLIYSVPNHDSFMGLDDENFLDMPPHHMGLWDENSLLALETFFPIKATKILLEPLQSYHLDYYKAVFEKKFPDKFSLKKAIFEHAENEPDKIKGFTILVEYVKK